MDALHLAAHSGNLADVELLLHDPEIDVNALDEDGLTSMDNAIEQGHSNVVAALLAAGADIEGVPDERFTPLCHAAWNYNEEIVALLLEAGADVDAVSTDLTALQLACQRSEGLGAVKVLLAAGADPNKYVAGTGPIHIATIWGNNDILIELIRAGADVNARVKENGGGWG